MLNYFCLASGVDNPGHEHIMTVGCVAGDEESYEVFAELFDPIIDERHGGFKPGDKHKTDLDFSKVCASSWRFSTPTTFQTFHFYSCFTCYHD